MLSFWLSRCFRKGTYFRTSTKICYPFEQICDFERVFIFGFSPKICYSFECQCISKGYFLSYLFNEIMLSFWINRYLINLDNSSLASSNNQHLSTMLTHIVLRCYSRNAIDEEGWWWSVCHWTIYVFKYRIKNISSSLYFTRS